MDKDEALRIEATTLMLTLNSSAPGSDNTALISKLKALATRLGDPALSSAIAQAISAADGTSKPIEVDINALAVTGNSCMVGATDSWIDVRKADKEVMLTFDPSQPAASPEIVVNARPGQIVTVGSGFTASGRNSVVAENATVVIAEPEAKDKMMEALLNERADVIVTGNLTTVNVMHEDPKHRIHVRAAHVQVLGNDGRPRDVEDIQRHAHTYRSTCGAMGRPTSMPGFEMFLEQTLASTPRQESGHLGSPRHELSAGKNSDFRLP